MRMLLAVLATLAVLGDAQAASRAWNFKVYLNDQAIGRHSFTADWRGGELRLASIAKFEVRFLFVTVYSYDHRAEESWRAGCLTGLEARTVINGTVEEARLARVGGRWQVSRTTGHEDHDGCLRSFAYWDPAILAESRLLNSQTGELMAVTAAFVGNETRAVRGRPTDTRRHRLTGARLAIDLWYAGDEWVALESATDGGRLLRYELD
jgi:hypothetical protein